MNTSNIKTGQIFSHSVNGQRIKVAGVSRTQNLSRKDDVCRVLSFGNTGLLVRSSSRLVLADSIRRKYHKV